MKVGGWPALGSLALLSGLGVLLVGCGDHRSASAVCHVWNVQGGALHAQFNRADQQAAGADPLGALGQLAAAPAELASLMQQMANVAPSSVVGDFANLARGFQAIAKSESGVASDPLSMFGNGLMLSVTEADSVQRVNQFLVGHCSTPSS